MRGLTPNLTEFDAQSSYDAHIDGGGSLEAALGEDELTQLKLSLFISL